MTDYMKEFRELAAEQKPGQAREIARLMYVGWTRAIVGARALTDAQKVAEMKALSDAYQAVFVRSIP